MFNDPDIRDADVNPIVCQMSVSIAGMSGLDLIALGVLAYNTLRGLTAGLVRTACGLAAIAAASVVATRHPEWGKPLVDPFFEPGSLVSGLMQPAAIWMATFLTVNGAGILLRMAVHKTFLKHVDRLGGAAFGLAAGVILLAAPLVVMEGLPLLKEVGPLQAELEKSIVVMALSPLTRALEPVVRPPAARNPGRPDDARNR